MDQRSEIGALLALGYGHGHVLSTYMMTGAVQPELSWQPIDSMTIVLGRDVLGGGSSTFFGQFRDNDRIRLRISYTF